MGFAARSELPTFTLAEIPDDVRHLVLTPATRWRVVVEQVEAVRHDLLLDAVARLRAAGERSAARIADLLQLPEDLVRHLLTQVVSRRIVPSSNGQLQTAGSRVGWVYRDIETGDLWPEPAAEAPPLAVEMNGQYGVHVRGTAGRPVKIRCLLLDTREDDPREPSGVELARFSKASSDQGRRTALIGSGGHCLVASPVVAVSGGYSVLTSQGVPHLALTQHLGRIAGLSQGVARWLAHIPQDTVRLSDDPPLARAVTELHEALQVDATVESLLSRVELCVSRFVDHYQYSYGLSTVTGRSRPASDAIASRYELDPDQVKRLIDQGRGSIGYKVAMLLQVASEHPDPPRNTTSLLTDLAVLATSLVRATSEPDTSTPAERVAEDTIDLCQQLITTTENP